MIEDMQIRKLAPKNLSASLLLVRRLVTFLGYSPHCGSLRRVMSDAGSHASAHQFRPVAMDGIG
jgi:hypothetical protein